MRPAACSAQKGVVPYISVRRGASPRYEENLLRDLSVWSKIDLTRRDLGVLLMHAGRYDDAEPELLAYSKSPLAEEDTEPERRALQALLMALPSLKAERAVREQAGGLFSLGHPEHDIRKRSVPCYCGCNVNCAGFCYLLELTSSARLC